MERKSTIKRRELLKAIDEQQFGKSESLSTIIYGLTILKLSRSSKASLRRFYIQDFNKSTLQWISPSKSLKKSSILITQIHKLEIGGLSKPFLNYKPPYDKSLALSIYYSTHTLNLLFANLKELQLWTSGLQYLIGEIQSEQANSSQENLIDKAWSLADTNNSGTLNITEIKSLMHSLNFYIDEAAILSFFQSFDNDKNGLIDKEEFRVMVDKLMQKPEIDELFKRFSNKTGCMELAGFQRFCQELQKDGGVAEDEFKEIAEEEAGVQVVKLGSFVGYVMNCFKNSIINRQEEDVWMDMDQPLMHYFIASSHNTYLEGNQLTGTSSISQYSKVLLEGCRCIEIDSWDGEDEPVVTHGHTLVNKITLRDVTLEIKKSAFITSSYPVIISLENHCSYEQTGKIGEIFQSILKDSIYKPSEKLGTPESLKFKFIIKAKTDSSHGSDSNVHPNLSKIVALVASAYSSSSNINNITSISEKKFGKMVENNGRSEMVGFNMFTFSRIYPKGMRINSSNYNPIQFWTHGAQIVAINYQSNDLGMLLNNCLFGLNGKSGYILKPSSLRDPSLVAESDKKIKLTLHFIIVSASNLPKSSSNEEIISPYVKISIIGIPSDCGKVSTRVVSKNGFNPVWKEQFSFHLKFPEVSFVVFKICCKKNLKTVEIAQSAVFVPSISSGFRVVQLLDSELDLIPSCSLLLNISKQDYEIQDNFV